MAALPLRGDGSDDGDGLPSRRLEPQADGVVGWHVDLREPLPEVRRRLVDEDDLLAATHVEEEVLHISANHVL